MEKIIRKRESGLDLLKIIAMLLIVMHHYTVHGGYDYVCLANLNKGRIFVQEVGMYGSLCCNIFALITGYFLVSEKYDVKRRVIKLAKLMLEMYFYSLLIYVVVCLSPWGGFSWETFKKACFPFLWGNWYVIGYLLLYLISPYLNTMLNNLSKRAFERYLVIIILLWSVIPTFTMFTPSWQWSNMDFFVVMYSVGAYVRLHYIDSINEKHKKIWLIIAILSNIFIVSSVLGLNILGKYLNSEILVQNSTFIMPMYTIPSVICSVSWFVVFLNFHFYSKIITILGNATLGIYLIHENDFLRPIIWQIVYPNKDYINNPYFHFIVKIAFVFVGCILIELVRSISISKVEDKIISFIQINKCEKQN